MTHHIHSDAARQAHNHNIAVAYQIETYGATEALFGRGCRELKSQIRSSVWDARNRQDATQEFWVNYYSGMAIPKAIRDASCKTRRAARPSGFESLDKDNEEGLSAHELTADEKDTPFADVLSIDSGECNGIDTASGMVYESENDWRAKVLDAQTEGILDDMREPASQHKIGAPLHFDEEQSKWFAGLSDADKAKVLEGQKLTKRRKQQLVKQNIDHVDSGDMHGFGEVRHGAKSIIVNKKVIKPAPKPKTKKIKVPVVDPRQIVNLDWMISINLGAAITDTRSRVTAAIDHIAGQFRSYSVMQGVSL
jgi:hypothetical protein